MGRSALLLTFRNPNVNRLADDASAFGIVTSGPERDEMVGDAEAQGYVLEAELKIQVVGGGDFDDATLALGKLVKVGVL